jgi:cell division protein FtsI (penicillin-binding protein 3)
MTAGGFKRADATSFPLPRFRAPVVFGVLGLVFAGLLGRALYLQSVDNDFLQERGAARFSREIELPAHRGRVVDRSGDVLAVSTPVKSLWTFPDKFDATPAELAALARVLETTPAKLTARGDEILRPREADSARAGGARDGTEDQGTERAKRIPPRIPRSRRSSASPVTGTPGRKASSSRSKRARQAMGSRRVIINRRGDAVEDVAAIRAPQADATSRCRSIRGCSGRVPRAEGGREKFSAKAGGVVVIDLDWRDTRARQPADVQPERATRSRASRCQSRAHRRVRAGLVVEAVHDRDGARNRRWRTR